MKILFIHEVNYAEKVVFEMHDYPELLSLRGHDVTFVDFPEDATRSGTSRILDLRTRVQESMSRAHEGAAVRVVTPGRVLAPPFDRPLASITHIPVLWRMLKRGSFDAVVLYGVPTNGWQTILLARMLGVPVLFRAIDVSHALRETRLSRLIGWAERFIYRRADAISTHNVGLAEYVAENGGDRDRISIEYPGIDLERFRPVERDAELALRLGIDADSRVIVFMGTLYRFAGLDDFLRRVSPYLRDDRSIVVLLVGGGEEEDSLKRLVVELGVDQQVQFSGFVDYSVLASYLSLGDVAINPFEPSAVTHNALPGKALQYLACGLPLVTTPLTGLSGLIGHDQSTVFAEPGEDFVRATLALLADEHRRSVAAASARALMEQICDWDRAIVRFEERIKQLVSKTS